MNSLNGGIRPMTGAVGAELIGVDLGNPSLFADIQAAVLQYGVVFFRGQRLTCEQEVAFAAALGSVSPTVNLRKVERNPLIDEVRKEPGDNRALGDTWHSDQTFHQRPPRYTMLFAKETPPVGGDTSFIGMAAAYDALSDSLKSVLGGLRAVHIDSGPFGQNRFEGRADVAQAIHPVVVRLPVSGRKALYVNPDKTIQFAGWTREESAGLLDFLYRHAQKPEFGCRFRWDAESVAVWDNFQTWHYATNDYPGQRRVMHRITVSADHFE